MRAGVVALLLTLAACGQPTNPNPNLGVHVDSQGRVSPSASANIGGVWVGGSGSGGAIGTRLGPIGISAGL